MTLDEDQARVLQAPADRLVVVSGPSGSGKTTALAACALQSPASFAGAPAAASCHRLRELLAPTWSGEIATVQQLAAGMLRRICPAVELDIIDEVDASILFERAAEPLLSMEWAEFVEAQIDPEVPGLRAPERFLEAAFRLISKLRTAQISPDAFLDAALKGATNFYARPPNLSHPELLYYTKDSYRDSLHADAAELQRQHRREVDLAKILHKLYRSYLDLLVARGCLTGADAVAEATRRLAADAATREQLCRSHARYLIDDAQELTAGELLFLQALLGPDLPGVVFFGDAASAITTFAGARPDRVFALDAVRIELETRYRPPMSIERAARHLSGAPAPGAGSEGEVRLFRAATKHAEAAFVADNVRALVASGIKEEQIAILFRSVAQVEDYEDALLDRNIDVQRVGDVNIFAARDALDALALLWNVQNPFAHEWLLRTLCGRAYALSDAAIATLCAEPSADRALPFAGFDAGDAERRWDRRRDVRLGWNVLRGEQDEFLSATARERLCAFRAQRAEWLCASAALPLPDLAATIFAQGLARAGTRDSARARAQERNVRRLLERIRAFSERRPEGRLADFLQYAAMRMNSGLESCEENAESGVVRMASITAAIGSQFDHVFLPNARAGSFPRYYVPDAFLFSPSLGMVAKENAGDARASRTAKFTYYMYRAKTRESYNREERRAFVYALRRARSSVTVTASERATRGLTAPEFLSELQAAGLPQAVDLSDRWSAPDGARAR